MEEKEVSERNREGQEGEGGTHKRRGMDRMKMSVPFIPKLPLHHCQYTTA